MIYFSENFLFISYVIVMEYFRDSLCKILSDFVLIIMLLLFIFYCIIFEVLLFLYFDILKEY